jgi:hypothetical protein
MMPIMMKEADLDRIEVPEDYEVLDATALGRRLGFKRDTVGAEGAAYLNSGPYEVVGQPQPDGETILLCKVHRHPSLRLIVGNHSNDIFGCLWWAQRSPLFVDHDAAKLRIESHVHAGFRVGLGLRGEVVADQFRRFPFRAIVYVAGRETRRVSPGAPHNLHGFRGYKSALDLSQSRPDFS